MTSAHRDGDLGSPAVTHDFEGAGGVRLPCFLTGA